VLRKEKRLKGVPENFSVPYFDVEDGRNNFVQKESTRKDR
jgi:hypothetical protein